MDAGTIQVLGARLHNQRDVDVERAPTLYVMDEPTSGLHPADVHRLLAQLHTLVDAGHTVVLAEHDPAAVTTADHVVEMGPGAGDEGGRVVSVRAGDDGDRVASLAGASLGSGDGGRDV